MGDRICVAGGPKSGKTTYANNFESTTRVRHTDSIIGKFGEDRDAWSRESEEVARWFDEPGPWLIEGVTVARALRKWIARHLDEPRVPRTPKQEAMAKATKTVFEQVRPQLERLGVKVVMGETGGEGRA